uniref:Inositol polyphosphate-related phosphatase domain-containing protein n=1 Tax=Paramoeba aestuarina TaxID=180227 RepID=A0A7S4JKZ5_9EUKA
MGDAPPPPTLDPWLPRGGYDIVVIGVQECEYTARQPHDTCEADWFSCVQDHMGRAYVKLAGTSLLSIRLCVLVKRSIYYRITNIQLDTIATGIGNVIGNKGGVGVAFKFDDSSFCFIGSHLAAHQEKTELRNSNYRDIAAKLKLRALVGRGRDLDVLNQFDHVFWMGDLNYRIDGLSRQEVLLQASQRNWEALNHYDQLRLERECGNAFAGFREAHIAFPPTYKYMRGDEYIKDGMREYTEERMRIPSWCDRILWRNLPDCSVRNDSYNCFDTITTSDHSPVAGTFYVRCARLPRPSKKAKFAIHIVQLECKVDEDKEGTKIHPNILIFGKIFEHEVEAQKRKGSHVVWDQGTIPVLYPFIGNYDYISRNHIFFLVRNSANNNSELGQAVLSMKNISEKELDFEAKLYSAGRITGALFGKMKISLEE